jgi:ABC-type multidrug transport system ATPase subunit
MLREWKAGKKIRERLGLEKDPEDMRDLDRYIWQLPLFAFLIYFTYIYVQKDFWIFFFSIVSWFMLIIIWNPLYSFLGRKKKIPSLIKRALNITVYWLIPLANLIIFQLKWDNLAAVIVIGFLWYAGLMIWSTGRYLQKNETDIYRMKGRFKNLRKAYYKLVLATPLIGKVRKPFKALGGVSMEIGNGMFGLLGPNGAGKTTLMRIICGILDQSYGKIWINGLDVAEKREELQGLIGYLPQEFGTYENMTAWEFLQHQAILKNITDRRTRNERVSYVLKAVHMHERKDEKIGSYSGGMKQRIGIAQILLHLPRILVVDEPTAGLDPRERIRFRNLLVELSRERVVIFSTHIIEDISSSCNKVAVLDKGYLKYLGHPEKMTREAEGRVWQFNIPANEFRKFASENMVVHHMSEKGSIRVRCIAADKPHPGALEVNPNLEDSYLWLLRKSKNEIA